MQKQQYLYKAPNHAANLNEMRLKDKWCDITIKVGGREIRAHKMILAANLKYFDAMLSDDSFQESEVGVISMESVEEVDLEKFVYYAYTGEMLLTDSNALNLLELANYLSEDGIKEACIEFLKEHLKVEEACRAYKFAKAIDSLTLKNTAKAIILNDFKTCSEDVDFLDFDNESLIDILSCGKAYPMDSQQMFFEGILKWIIHDKRCRKIYLEELLNSISITKMKTDNLIACLHRNIKDRNDEHGIVKDIIFYYQDKIEQRKSGQALMVLGSNENKVCFKFYNYQENKWFSIQETLDIGGNINPYSAVFNNKLYFVKENSGVHYLQVLNPMTKESTALHSSNTIFKFSSVCACSKFIYLCGGMIHTSTENHVMRYNPETNCFKKLTSMGTKRVSAASIFYHGCLYVLGGYGEKSLNSVEKYDPATETWTTAVPMLKERYRHAVVELDGKLYACGGYPFRNTVEVYDPTINSWQPVASMNKNREFFFAVALEGKLLAVGGDLEKTVEVYDPSMDQWQINDDMSPALDTHYLLGGLISSSCIADVN